MKEINNPISLSGLRASAYEAGGEIASTIPGVDMFDGRRDFLVNANLSGLAVLIMLTNERRLHASGVRGIRRRVQVALIDETVNSVLGSKYVGVNMPAHLLADQYRVDFPIDYSDVNTDHSYKLIVRDECSHRILGEETLHFFDNVRCGRHVSEWFSIRGGSVVDMYGEKYRCVESVVDTYYKVRFDIELSFVETPMILPEFEVRIYSPDGRVYSRFCRPCRDEYEPDEFHLEAPFLTNRYNRGVYYAEIICMDYPVSGIVFATDYETHGGEWEDGELSCLDEYSLEAATERFHSAMGIKLAHSETHLAETDSDEDVFDRLIQEFIDSQMDDDVETKCDEEPLSEGFIEQPDVEKSESAVVEPSIISQLDNLTGLSAVKEKLTVYEMVVKFNKMRLDNNLPMNPQPLHAMFLGAPGTGKTTVAKMMGAMLRKAGVLSRGHVVVKERATLLGPNYSMEETNTINAIDEAQGGILLIDEAYQLYQPNDPRDPGKFVIEALMTALADESRRDWMLILAGYQDEMTRMFEMNPGFKSRIPDSNIYLFDDFTESELMEIAERYLSRNHFSLSPKAREAMMVRLADDYRFKDKSFGNARHVINLIQTEILPAMAVRVMSNEDVGPEMLSVIEPSDIPQPVNRINHSRPMIGFRA